MPLDINSVPHFAEAINMDSEYASKYIELISEPYTGWDSHKHHIVPAFYYEIVLGCRETRRMPTKTMPASPDMDPRNLVFISPANHIIAHYYLTKCMPLRLVPSAIKALRITYVKYKDNVVDDSLDQYVSSIEELLHYDENARKGSNINCRIPNDLVPVLEYLKTAYPGGISGWVESRLREVNIDYELLSRINALTA